MNTNDYMIAGIQTMSNQDSTLFLLSFVLILLELLKIKLIQQKLKINTKENKKAVLREEIKAKEILLQRRDELTNKINVLIEQLNS